MCGPLVPCNGSGSGEWNGMRIYDKTYANKTGTKLEPKEHTGAQRETKKSEEILENKRKTKAHKEIQENAKGKRKEYKGIRRNVKNNKRRTLKKTKEYEEILRNTKEYHGKTGACTGQLGSLPHLT